MTTEANKQLVKDFWASFSAADAETVVGLLSRTCQVAGDARCEGRCSPKHHG